jgi:hypothetical protein
MYHHERGSSPPSDTTLSYMFDRFRPVYSRFSLLGGRSAAGSGLRRSLPWLCHPALTGLPPQQWDALIAALTTLHDQQRETSLDKRRGRRPRLIAPGVGRRPGLTLADRLLAAVLHQRLALPQTAIAALFSVRPETINKRIRDVRQLLQQAGYAIQSGPHRLTSLDDLYKLAATEGILIPAGTKAAC